MLFDWRFGPVLGLVTGLAGAVAAQDLKLVRIGTLDVRSDFVQAGSGIYVSGHRSDTGNELWRIGQRPDRLELVRDIFGTKPNGAQGHANPRGLTAFQGRLYFFASNSEILNQLGFPSGRVSNGLWVTDGSEGGTRPLMGFEPVKEDKRSAPPLVEAGGALFFTARDGEHGLELWRTSGTRETTVLVRDLWRGAEGSTSVMGAVEEQVLFAGSDGRLGGELWRSDGTSRGTVLVRDINGVPAPSTIDLVGETLSVIDGEAYFAANDSRHGTELWRTTEGRQDAQMVLDLTEGPQSSRFEDMRVAGENLFVAQVVSNAGALNFLRLNDERDGFDPVTGLPGSLGIGTFAGMYPLGDDLLVFVRSAGVHMWRIGGDAKATFVKTLVPSVPQGLRRIEAVTVGSEVVLRVSRSVWRSNGTDAGTQRLEAFDDPDVSGSHRLFAKDGFVYFSMRDAEGRMAVFRTDPALCTQGGLITAAQPHCATSTGAGSVLGANPVVSGQ